MPSPCTAHSTRPCFQPLLASSHQAEITPAPQQAQPQVSAAGLRVLRQNLKIFFFLSLKPKWSTFSRFPPLLLHWLFALSLCRPYVLRHNWRGDAMLWTLDFARGFILLEFLVFVQQASLTAFHEYRRLLQRSAMRMAQKRTRHQSVTFVTLSICKRPDSMV